MENSYIVISCWFGPRFNKPSRVTSFFEFKWLIKYKLKSLIPFYILEKFGIKSVIPNKPKSAKSCLFFSNNRKLKSEITKKGWQFKYVDKSIDNGESLDSSLQAKSVKFLQLDNNTLDQVFSHDYALYMDSRRICEHTHELIEQCDKGILIRYTPRVKNSIWDEVEEANSQERYALNMPETIAFINKKIQTGYTPDNRVMNTGLIVYKLNDKAQRESVLALCREVYDTCIILDQPECQIIWGLLSQKYDEYINKIEFGLIKTNSGY